MLGSRDGVRDGRGIHLRRRRDESKPARASESSYLEIASVGISIAPLRYLEEPLVAWLLSEDATWRFAHEQWEAGRPRAWRRGERASWHAEGRALEQKRERLRAAAAEIGLPISARPAD